MIKYINVLCLLALTLLTGGCGSGSTGGATEATTAGFLTLPYLIYAGNNTSMSLQWESDSAAGAQVTWGTDATCS
ncbi:MAG TPA: hypothetical protein VNX25_06935, partial [Verrucomicrobiae bacterium]|nr:hypothetical protein [Verrucomicrobiae bacterium]